MTEITPEIITAFRDKMTAFTDVSTWSDEAVTIALSEGDAETGGKGWGAYGEELTNFKQRGMFYYAAHYLASFYPSGDSTMSGGSAGAVASKSVGDESISYNRAAVDNAGQEWLSSTAFGQQFLMLKRRAGMGARAV